MALGKNVEALRKSKGLTFAAVASAVGTDAQAIKALEMRDSSRTKFAPELARFFGVTMEELSSEDFDVGALRSPTNTPEMEQPEVAQPGEVTQPGEAPARVQWVSDPEAELLSLFRTTDQEGRRTIMNIARAMTKSVLRGLTSNKP